jgi:isoquinoline 1-oxidoreductase beta subunit
MRTITKVTRRDFLAKVTRRDFLRTGSIAAGGLLLGFQLPRAATAQSAGPVAINAFVHVSPDDIVTLIIDKAEMGQGTVTSLAMLLAEEMEADWTRVRTAFAPVDPAYGASQGVFGSLSVRTSWNRLREAGATAAELLVQAGANRWGVDKSRVRAENGTIVNTATGDRLRFGELASEAAALPIPPNVAQKDPNQFRLLGTSPRRLDTPAKVTGQARYGIDVIRPGMLYASVEQPPVFGGSVARFDPAPALEVPGVRDVLEVTGGVAVVADNTWAAFEGRRALTIEWDHGDFASESSSTIRSYFERLADEEGSSARSEGTPPEAGPGQTIVAVYEAPYLAHSSMEPYNAVADVANGEVELWVGTQVQTQTRDTAARIAGVSPESVTLHSEYMGGGFGGKSRDGYVVSAVEISRDLGVPVKVTWTREDDTRHDAFRPASYVRFQGSVDADGWPRSFGARIVCPSFAGLRNGIDRTAVEGIADVEYAFDHIDVRYTPPDLPIPTWYWRSVGYSQNTFFMECFLDELAALGGRDPLEVRRRMLAGAPRLANVLNVAAERAGWSSPLPAGRGRGIAVVNNIGSFTAIVAEASVENGQVRVHRMVCAVDSGHIAHPGIIEQQIQSGVVYGLSQLKGGLTIEGGRVVEGNFHQYEVLRFDEMPVVETHIVPSTEMPGGIGEASTPPSAPAVLNAVFMASGKRVRRLPVRPDDLA